MIIESTEMIDRMKRAHLALMGNCFEEQARPDITVDRFLLLQKEIEKCERMITACMEKLIGSDYEH